jgi:hypothetical protein
MKGKTQPEEAEEEDHDGDGEEEGDDPDLNVSTKENEISADNSSPLKPKEKKLRGGSSKMIEEDGSQVEPPLE